MHFVTRRTTGRRFLLRPSRTLNRAIEYCVAVAAQRHNIKVHALIVMSNHWHAVVTDPDAQLPAFLRDAHAWIANCVKDSLDREWENVWDNRQTGLLRAEDDEDVLGRITYTMANPVEAGLVAHGKSWPGLRSCWPTKRQPVPRPALFADEGPMPESALLELSRPTGFHDMDDTALAALIQESVNASEAEHLAKHRRAGRRPLGARAIRRQSRFESPSTPSLRGTRSPKVAARSKQRRLDALTRLRLFLDQYRAAFKLWQAGFRDVVFPAGTYALRLHASVPCSPD